MSITLILVMADDQNKPLNQDEEVHERPLDPTRDAKDLLGDTTGLTGITDGKPKKVSAEPDEPFYDMTNEPAGSLGKQSNAPATNSGMDRAMVSDKANANATLNDMSSTRAAINDDTASGVTTPGQPTSNVTNNTGNDPQTTNQQQNNTTPVSDDGNNTMQTPMSPPSIQGEQSVSGDMPDPGSDDDTLANAQAMGQQTEEDPEHPEELDIARDVDNAEEALHNS